MKTFPKTIYVYVCDMDGDTPILAVETDPANLPADEDGEKVATYVLVGVNTLVVTKELV